MRRNQHTKTAPRGAKLHFALITRGDAQVNPALGRFAELTAFRTDGRPEGWMLLRLEGASSRTVASGDGPPPWNSDPISADLLERAARGVSPAANEQSGVPAGLTLALNEALDVASLGRQRKLTAYLMALYAARPSAPTTTRAVH